MAVDVILRIRGEGPKKWSKASGVRPFKQNHHKINMDTMSLETLNAMGIQEAVTEPPITQALSGSQLLDLRERPLQIRLPGCSVAVERGVKDVTEAALLATDSLERDGLSSKRWSQGRNIH